MGASVNECKAMHARENSTNKTHTAAGSKSAASVKERDAAFIVDNFLEMPTQCSEGGTKVNRLLGSIKIKRIKKKKNRKHTRYKSNICMHLGVAIHTPGHLIISKKQQHNTKT